MKGLKELEADAKSQLTAFEAKAVARGEVEIKRFVKALAEREGVDFIELVSGCAGLEGMRCKFIFPGCVGIYLDPCCKTHSNRDLRWEGEKLVGDYCWEVWGYWRHIQDLGTAIVKARRMRNRIND